MPISEALSAIAIDQLPSLISKLAETNALKYGGNAANVKTFISPHIEAIYNKCSTIKTMLNPEEEVNFLSIYSAQRFNIAESRIDQFDFVDLIKKGKKNYILTGTGGSGKSFFTKYLWLSLFNDSAGKIPLYIELRNLNLSEPDLLTYIRTSITTGKSTISEKEFNKKVFNGEFFLILDGFDELSADVSQKVQNQIIHLSNESKDISIFVSSRPEYNFGSWSKFSVVSIESLNKDQCLDLIRLAPFNEQTKTQFAKKVDKELFDKHEEFLSSPLLTCMMLITFSSERDIPGKMHQFYGDAYNALYKRHDRNKEGGFIRQYYSNISEDDFKRLFSFFCFYSYYKEIFDFDYELLFDCINKSSEIAGVEVRVDSFIEDLTKSVCLIIKDGSVYSFSHRSFQEYFAARCLNYISRDKVKAFMYAFAARKTDQVLYLAYDMYPDLVRDELLINYKKEFSEYFPKIATKKAVLKYSERAGYHFHFSKTQKSSSGSNWFYMCKLDSFYGVVAFLKNKFPDKFAQHLNSYNFKMEDSYMAEIAEFIGAKTINSAIIRISEGSVVMRHGREKTHVLDSCESFYLSNIYALLRADMKGVSDCLIEIERDADRCSDLIDTLL